MTVTLRLLAALCLANAATSFAEEPPLPGSRTLHLSVGLGADVHQLGKMAGSKDGSIQSFNAWFALLRLEASIPTPLDEWNSRLLFRPQLGLSPLAHASPEGGERSYLMFLTAPVAWRIFDWFEPRLGPCLNFYGVFGTGGTSVQKNGQSTETFALPSSPALSMILGIEAALAFQLDRFRLSVESRLAGFATARQSLDLAVSFTMGVL